MYHFTVFFILSTIALVSTNVAHIKGVANWFGLKKPTMSEIKLSDLVNHVKSIFSVVNSGQNNYSDTIEEDKALSIEDFVSSYGYNLENHHVQTEDGYQLTLHRLTREENNSCTRKYVDVFLMHGLLDSSDCWMLQGPNKSLAFILADEGYDVWMGNARGNKYSNTHVNMTTEDSQYWKFSWEEIGLYDLPAMIDYILEYMDSDSLYYVGHSQGTTSFFVMTSMKTEYNSKIKMMFALSPVAYMSNVKSPIVQLFTPANKFFASWLTSFNIYAPSVNFFNKFLSVTCFFVPKCDNILYLIVGNNNKLINETLLPAIFDHMPSGSSIMQFVHYGQLVESGRFCRYDFGEYVNTQVYKSQRPPDYDLQFVIVPVVLFYSKNDWLSDPVDVDLLKSRLPNVIGSKVINEYNHWDYLYATNAEDVIYRKVIEIMNENEHDDFFDEEK